MPFIGQDPNDISEEQTPSVLVLGGTIIFTNISTGDQENHNILHKNPANVILLGPPGNYITKEYTARCMCDIQEFKDFAYQNSYRPMSLTFEGESLWGYLTEYSMDKTNETITFTFEAMS